MWQQTYLYKVISGHVIFSFVVLGDNIIKVNKLVWRRWNQMWHNIKCFALIFIEHKFFLVHNKNKQQSYLFKTMSDWL